MNQYVDNILDAFEKLANDNQQLRRISALAPELGWAENSDIDSLLERMVRMAKGNTSETLERGWQIIIGHLASNASDSQEPVSPQRLSLIHDFYDALQPASRTRNMLLGWLATLNTTDSLEKFTDLMVDDPPQCKFSIVAAFAPLVQRDRSFEIECVFPRLLGALGHSSVSAAVLDLANFVFREGRSESHPAEPYREQLSDMLGMLTEQLALVEEGRPPGNAQPQQISQMVNESVALITSICHALSLLGDDSAIGRLNRVAELKHRRIRTEALSALCQLGEQHAAKQLAQMASEPVARVRVLAYANELGLLDEVDDQYKTAESRAEGELALWLAHPTNMGIAPTNLQLVDQRQLNWPSYDEPLDAFLFKYRYESSAAAIENIGIAGPLVHAFAPIMNHLPVADIYACFAGWHCRHDEIFELTIDQARQQRPGLVERLLSRLASEKICPIEMIDPRFVGLFMGEEVLIAAGISADKPVSFVVDRDQVEIFEPQSTLSDADHDLAYCIYKGRRLLGAFNSLEVWPGARVEVK